MKTTARNLQAAFEADFFRCAVCGTAFTLVEQADFITSNSRGPCPDCHANRYRQVNFEDLPWWWRWGSWRAWRMRILRLWGHV